MMFKLLIVLFASIYVAHAYEAIGRLEKIPEKFKDQEGCYVRNLDVVIPFGKSVQVTCEEYSCSTSKYGVRGCGTVRADPPCKVVEDKTKVYPGCCPTVQCP